MVELPGKGLLAPLERLGFGRDDPVDEARIERNVLEGAPVQALGPVELGANALDLHLHFGRLGPQRLLLALHVGGLEERVDEAVAHDVEAARKRDGLTHRQAGTEGQLAGLCHVTHDVDRSVFDDRHVHVVDRDDGEGLTTIAEFLPQRPGGHQLAYGRLRLRDRHVDDLDAASWRQRHLAVEFDHRLLAQLGKAVDRYLENVSDVHAIVDAEASCYVRGGPRDFGDGRSRRSRLGHGEGCGRRNDRGGNHQGRETPPRSRHSLISHGGERFDAELGHCTFEPSARLGQPGMQLS